MEKNVKKLVEGYKNYTRSGVKVRETPGAPDTTLSESDLEEPKYIDNYRSYKWD